MILMLGVFAANAQYTSSVPAISNGGWGTVTLPYYTAGDDTATTGGDVIRMGIIMNGKYDVSLKLVATKVSGTLAGTAIIRVSNDGTNWRTINEAAAVTYKDTVTVGDETTTATWSFTAAEVNAKYIEVNYTTTGTNVSAPVSTLYYRKSED